MGDAFRTPRRHGIGFGLAAALTLSLFALPATALATVHTHRAATQVVTIGLIEPTTGAGAVLGEQIIDGADLAVADLNREAAAEHKPFRFKTVVENSQCDPQDANTATLAAIQQAHVNAMVGEVCSDATLVVRSLAGQYKVPVVVPDSSAHAITAQGNPYTFRIIPDEVLQHEILAVVAKNFLHFHHVVAVHEQTASGDGAANSFVWAMQRIGDPVVADIAVSDTAPNYASTIAYIKSLHPDAIDVTMLINPAVRFIQQLYQSGVRVPILDSIWFPQPEYAKLLGPAAIGTVSESFFQAGYNKAFGAAAFTSEFEARYHTAPDYQNAEGYASAKLIGDTVLRIGKTSPVDIAAGLRQTRDYPSVIGMITFNSQGQAEFTPTSMILVKNLPGLKLAILNTEPGFKLGLWMEAFRGATCSPNC
ncbi:MAG: ABC transporter substrate-binding protein [Firmicutes bacterium]|nr:ABC transporter substrate-binding protein [Bacillota bacterium]